VREAQLTLARKRVTQYEWAIGDSLRLGNIPVVEDTSFRAGAATAQIAGLLENIFQQPFFYPAGAGLSAGLSAPRRPAL